MTRARTKKKKPEPDALYTFQILAKVDALLFSASQVLRELNLKDIERPVEQARKRAAKRLEACQTEAYRQMCSDDQPKPGR